MNNSFVKQAKNSDKLFALIKHHPNAFILLTIIAQRARRLGDPCDITGLEQNQAYIGDFKEYGMSRQNYRTALKVLKSNHQVTIEPTTKGSIVTLCDSGIYDITPEQSNHQATTDQPSPNHRLTTKKKERREEEEEISAFNSGKKEPTDAEKVQVLYNQHRKNMPECMKLTPIRISQINARIKEVGFDQLCSLLVEAIDLPLFQGDNDRGWTASLEWMTKGSSFLKIREGFYKKTKRNTGQHFDPTVY